jgi:uncharacterized membrane protein
MSSTGDQMWSDLRRAASLDLNLSPGLRTFLSKVYGTVAASLACALVGVAFNYYFNIAGTITALLAIATMVYVHASNPARVTRRFYLTLFSGFLIGLNGSVALARHASINPTLPLTALLATLAVFGSVTVAGLMATSPKHFYFLTAAGSVISYISMASVFSLLLGSLLPLPYWAYTAAAVAVLCAQTLIDAHRVVRAYNAGSDDYVTPALTSFTNFAAMYVRILQLLQEMSKNSDNGRRRRGSTHSNSAGYAPRFGNRSEL